MSLWSWEEHRGPAPLSPAVRRSPDPIPWCALCPVFCRNTPSPHGPVANAQCPRGASPCRPHRRGRGPRGSPPLGGEHKAYLSLASATQWWKKPRLLCACPPQCLHQFSAGDALATHVKTPVAPDASPGWTMVWRAWATRVRWARPCGRHDRTLWQQARGLVCQVIEPTGDRTLRTAGERREGSRWCALCRQARRNGTRGRPQKTLPQGGTGRLQPTGAHRPQRGPQRPHAPAPSPEPPDTAPPLATHELPAPPLAACQTSLRRRWAAYRRRTHRYAKTTGRLPARFEVSWRVPHGVRGPLTTRQGPAVACGVGEERCSLPPRCWRQQAASMPLSG